MDIAGNVCKQKIITWILKINLIEVVCLELQRGQVSLKE